MSIRCDDLHRFADGEVDDDEARAFRHHLGRCPICPGRLVALIELDALVSAAVVGASAAPSRSTSTGGRGPWWCPRRRQRDR
jgi:anti-sigma factor RsiW